MGQVAQALIERRFPGQAVRHVSDKT